ncbi:MAG: acyl-CoA desaturase [Acidobacteria bacterium]|nr:acyl-CoA desaturase [Acidobacteriota bacterium]
MILVMRLLRDDEKVQWLTSAPFLLMHLGCLAAFWTGASPAAILACIALYWVRMFGITAGYHRYLAHASFKTGRVFQFVLTWIACCSMQKGPLWWAAHHRHHHAHSDEPDDIHSPVQRGFFWSHMGWILCTKYEPTRWHLIPQYAKYPELVWMNRFHPVPGLSLAAAMFVFGALAPASWGTSGWQMLIWGWLLSTVLLYHGTFTINSLSHVYGTRRYDTGDASRNNWLLALVTMGEGWHNNHHHYPSSASMGFRWWEVDTTLYILKVLAALGIVWDLKFPPLQVLNPPANRQVAA